ncbi:hypothetical protein DLM75_19710 [Leptospira stimsonii]|uniref:Uncharacterized protein n=1 Tax=Leptospira stimsonii TaxID=2202203 RepID=A0A396YT53_9LEPT|nr:hypothetical protein DLM75_19710 [Leptospira stimsonii]
MKVAINTVGSNGFGKSVTLEFGNKRIGLILILISNHPTKNREGDDKPFVGKQGCPQRRDRPSIRKVLEHSRLYDL